MSARACAYDEGGLGDKGVAKVGALLSQHPQIETAFRGTLIHLRKAGELFHAPIDFAWTTGGNPLPWPSLITAEEKEFRRLSACDLQLVSPVANVRSAHRYVEKDPAGLKALGFITRIFLTLLSTVNDLPTNVREVTASKGFVAQGRYRKFLDHAIVTLTLPKGRDPQKVARQIIARARKRAHEVRGHWRDDWRKPLRDGCLHEFDEYMVCHLCGGHQFWIRQHQRGDVSLGFVTHDYKVEHKEASHAH
jgi:hypothetical protein